MSEKYNFLDKFREFVILNQPQISRTIVGILLFMSFCSFLFGDLLGAVIFMLVAMMISF
jgi:hypothetical protein